MLPPSAFPSSHEIPRKKIKPLFPVTKFSYDANNRLVSPRPPTQFRERGASAPLLLHLRRPQPPPWSAGILPASYAYDSVPPNEATTRPGAERTRPYDTYGKTFYCIGTTNTPYLYVGQFGVKTDPIGLHDMRAQHYNQCSSYSIN
jgi:hypothetical protein